MADLETRLAALASHLLPTLPADTLREPTPEEVTRTLAFRLMAHAEMEDFLETRVQQVATAAITAFSTSGKVSRALLALACFAENGCGKPPPTLEPEQENQRKEWPKKIDVVVRAKLYVTSFLARVKENHGIKEENLLSLLLPVGVDPTTIDPTWLANCNSFGSARGEAAHTSSMRVSQPPNPADEKKRVEELVRGLAAIDNHLSDLLASCA
jgi:hypothetical protein